MTQRTPTGIISSMFGKRGHPSTSSSTEGTRSQVKKDKVGKDNEDLVVIQKDLLNVFDEEETAMVEDAKTEAVMKDFENHMEECFRTFKSQIQDQLKNVFQKVNERIKNLEERVESCERKLLEGLGGEKEVKRIYIELNRQAQYSRKDNLRIFGLPEEKGEDCKQAVCNLINETVKVKISPSDISAAHRLPQTGRQRVKPMIVRLKDRSQRFEILSNRTKLRKSGKSIAEDMTRENVILMKQAEESNCFKSVWFVNGKVKASNENGGYYILNLYDDFQEVRKRPAWQKK